MAITQERMLQLILAAEHFQNMFDNSIEMVRQRLQWIESGRMTGREAMVDLGQALFAIPESNAKAIISMERVRYQLTFAKNASELRRRERRKEELGGGIPSVPPTVHFSPTSKGKPIRPGILPGEEETTEQELAKAFRIPGALLPGDITKGSDGIPLSLGKDERKEMERMVEQMAKEELERIEAEGAGGGQRPDDD